MSLKEQNLSASTDIDCPNCGSAISQAEPPQIEFCLECGFPLVCEYTAPDAKAPFDRLRPHRLILLWGFLIFGIFQIFSSFYYSARANYEGYVVNLDTIVKPEVATGNLVLIGTAKQTLRLRKALAYIRRADYQIFRDIVKRIPSIAVTERDDFVINNGSRLDIEHIGGFINLPDGNVTIKRIVVDGTEPEQFYDRTLVTIAAVILHEYEHKRRFDYGISQKGAAEEIAVEGFVYNFLVKSNAPPGIIDEKKRYLTQPYLSKYDRWYRFGE